MPLSQLNDRKIIDLNRSHFKRFLPISARSGLVPPDGVDGQDGPRFVAYPGRW
jgi:hypothetical protein